MSTITKERLEQLANFRGAPVTRQEEQELARIALASLEAEAVSFNALRDAVAEVSGGPAMEWSDIYKGHQAVPFINFNSLARIVEKFRTATPAPVAVPDEYVAAVPTPTNLGYEAGGNACRAAMLQGAEPVTTAYKLPFEQWLSQQTGTIDVECGCVMTEVFFHWLRVAYEAGNSPVIPDGWVMVPEEPTHEMLEAGDEQFGTYDVYRRMIAASPQQEVK